MKKITKIFIKLKELEKTIKDDIKKELIKKLKQKIKKDTKLIEEGNPLRKNKRWSEEFKNYFKGRIHGFQIAIRLAEEEE